MSIGKGQSLSARTLGGGGGCGLRVVGFWLRVVGWGQNSARPMESVGCAKRPGVRVASFTSYRPAPLSTSHHLSMPCPANTITPRSQRRRRVAPEAFAENHRQKAVARGTRYAHSRDASRQATSGRGWKPSNLDFSTGGIFKSRPPAQSRAPREAPWSACSEFYQLPPDPVAHKYENGLALFVNG